MRCCWWIKGLIEYLRKVAIDVGTKRLGFDEVHKSRIKWASISTLTTSAEILHWA